MSEREVELPDGSFAVRQRYAAGRAGQPHVAGAAVNPETTGSLCVDVAEAGFALTFIAEPTGEHFQIGLFPSLKSANASALFIRGHDFQAAHVDCLNPYTCREDAA